MTVPLYCPIGGGESGSDGEYSGLASPLVSVITPVFRGEQTLVRAVRSLLAQDYPHWQQWIVIDDGVDYPGLLKAAGIDDPRIRFIDSGGVGSGPNRTRNLALAQADGDIIAPLDADDLYYPTRLSTLVPLAMAYGVAGDNVDVNAFLFQNLEHAHVRATLGTTAGEDQPDPWPFTLGLGRNLHRLGGDQRYNH